MRFAETLPSFLGKAMIYLFDALQFMGVTLPSKTETDIRSVHLLSLQFMRLNQLLVLPQVHQVTLEQHRLKSDVRHGSGSLPLRGPPWLEGTCRSP